jgi:hypothetical protein
MKSLTVSRLARTLSLAPAALVLHIAAAAAANSTDDLLEQQRAILSGKVTYSAAPASTARQDTGSSSEPLELTRRVLLGAPAQVRHPRPTTEELVRRHSAPDVQDWAQHVLAGHPRETAKS